MPWLTKSKAARALGVSERILVRRLARGEIATKRERGVLLVCVEETAQEEAEGLEEACKAVVAVTRSNVGSATAGRRLGSTLSDQASRKTSNEPNDQIDKLAAAVFPRPSEKPGAGEPGASRKGEPTTDGLPAPSETCESGAGTPAHEQTTAVRHPAGRDYAAELQARLEHITRMRQTMPRLGPITKAGDGKRGVSEPDAHECSPSSGRRTFFQGLGLRSAIIAAVVVVLLAGQTYLLWRQHVAFTHEVQQIRRAADRLAPVGRPQYPNGDESTERPIGDEVLAPVRDELASLVDRVADHLTLVREQQAAIACTQDELLRATDELATEWRRFLDAQEATHNPSHLASKAADRPVTLRDVIDRSWDADLPGSLPVTQQGSARP